MNIRTLFSVFCLLVPLSMGAQKTYWIFLSDKDGTHYQGPVKSPDAFDLPLRQDYRESLSPIVKTIIGESRWLNALAVEANDAQIKQVKTLPFVTKVQEMRPMHSHKSLRMKRYLSNDRKDVLAAKQLARMRGREFYDAGIRGQGIRIAVFDGGFPKVNTHQAFAHLYPNIIATHDFTRNDSNVYRGHSHGLQTLSCIGGMMKGEPIGLATCADYLLAITEYTRETHKEELYWLQAAEWAHEQGANIISSSLGYTDDLYFREMMDGQTTVVSRAANIAASKGILVVVSAGNSGSDKWHVIAAPADADSVLTVGAISPTSEIHANFSSYGPSADGRLKPNVCAYGSATVASRTGGYTIATGTSFSCPLVAGFAACLWQKNPHWSAPELKQAMEASSDLYPYYDYAHGYGVPVAHKEWISHSQNAVLWDTLKGNLSVRLMPDYARKSVPGHMGALYFHWADDNDRLLKYGICEVFQPEIISWPIATLTEKGVRVVRVHYQGSTYEYVL